MKGYWITVMIFLLLSCNGGGTKAQGGNEGGGETPKGTYSNPVINMSLPDPTVVKAGDGFFYLYATEDIRNVPIFRSADLVHWNMVGTAFTETSRPNFVPGGGIWAPDINYSQGKYLLYYSMSVWGGEDTCGVGVAVADKPEGPFTDMGKLFRSNEIGVTNSIDPFYIELDGARYLFWGSFRGIYYTELSADGLSVKEGAPVVQIAGTAFEATYIHERNGYYYLFASIGSCCEGVNSTYRLVVGRADNLFGPYTDKSGRDMLDNGFELVIGSNSRFTGNGHCSEIVTDDRGEDWIFYHGIDIQRPTGRVLMMDNIKWSDDGWPFVEKASPSLVSPVPNFNAN